MAPSTTKVKLESGSTDNQGRTDRHGSSRDYPVCISLGSEALDSNHFSLRAMTEEATEATANEAAVIEDDRALQGIEVVEILVARAM